MTRSLLLLFALSVGCSETATRDHTTAAPTGSDYHATIVSDRMDGDVREVKLSNGLLALLKEDHAAPVATFVVYYRVGSRNEHTGNTGSTHLLEHLQFKGTKSFPGKGAVWGAFARMGASFNATTAQDRTNFFETIPSDQLPFAIALEADRMRNSTFNDADRASEMTVVRNELERDENEPGTLLQTLTWATSFLSHPYHHPVIGWRSDVENVPTSRLRDFYDTYYQPDNAVAVAVGDFDSNEVAKLITQRFGIFPGDHTFPPVYTTEEQQRGERRSIIHKPGEIALLEMGWHFPSFNSPDVAPLKVLQLIVAGTLDVNEFGEPLSSGISNRLYQSLVESELATGAEMEFPLMRDPGLGALLVELNPGIAHEKVEATLRGMLDRIKREPVTEAELQRARNRARAAFALSQDGTFGTAMGLGSFGALGDWHLAREFGALVDKVTAADVQRVAKTYFADNGATVVWFVPDKTGPTASTAPPPIHVRRWAAYRDTDDVRDAQRVTARAVAARNAADGGGGASQFAPHKKTLSNGLRIIVQESHTSPTFALSGAILAGSVHESPTELDLSGVTADMMERGTTKHSKLALADQLAEVGASLSLAAGEETVGVSGLALKGDLDRVLDVLAEELLDPAFSQEELTKVIAEHTATTLQSEDSTAVKAQRELTHALYPKGHPLYIDTPDDVIASLRMMTPARVREWYQRLYGPDRTILTIVGDVDAEDVFARIERRLGGWARVGGPAVSAPAVPLNRKARRIDVAVPDKSSVDIVEGIQGTIARTDPVFYPAMLANFILGASEESRLFAQVRNERGLTYSIGSSLEATKLAGPWIISLSVNPAVIDKALAAVQTTVGDWWTNGVTQTELDDAKKEISGLFKVSLGSNRGLASVMNQYEVLGLGAEYVREHPKRIMAVTLDEVNQSIKTQFHPDALVTVVSGTIPPSQTK